MALGCPLCVCGPRLAFRVAGTVHTASWRSCGARGRRWPAAAFLVAKLRCAWSPLTRGCLSCGKRSTQSLLEELRCAWPPVACGCLPRWRPQCTELPGGAAARVAAAGPAAAFRVAGAARRASWRSCGARGRRRPAAAFRAAGAAHRASWRSCGARGRRWPVAAFRVAGAAHRASWLYRSWALHDSGLRCSWHWIKQQLD